MKKYPLLLFPAFFLLSCVQTGSGIMISTPKERPLSYEGDLNPEASPVAETNETPFIPDERFSAESIIRSYQKAYPDRITEIAEKKGDWAMKIYDQWFYWADGKILPEDMVERKGEYNGYPYYSYPDILPAFQELPGETKDRLDSMLERRKTVPLQRYPGFMNSLWRVYDRETSWNRVKTTYFLGFKLQIHRDLLEDLANVEEEIQRRMLVDSELRAFVQTLDRVDGYNWRRIAETNTLSVHSYGVALDLILNGKTNGEVYWLWTKNKGVDWYDVPYDQRFSPPLPFIQAFENQGFIWGGKWLFYDTIHFEYRPEILILNAIR